MSELLATTTDPAHGPASIAGLKVTPVDEVGLTERAAALTKRSIKRESKLAALDLAIRCMDLTTLEGIDTPGKVAALSSKAIRPDPTDPTIPSVAAVCVYPEMIPVAVQSTSASTVSVASVAGSFPAGLGPLHVRLDEIRQVVSDGADEVDIVLNRSAFLSGRYSQAFDEIAASKEAGGSAHLKVILETGELGSYDQVRRASMLAMAAGADFIKTSTGKIGTSATPPVALCMAEAIRDMSDQTGQQVGLKLAGGIRSAKQAWHYLVIVGETLGPQWLDPQWFRLGASSLLNDVLMQIGWLRTGRYQRPDDYTID
jgi:deoxyribose-phosphate aldolase